jgi:hypothetical protein
MMETLLLVAAAFFAGHWTAPVQRELVEVKVPVPVECREKVPDRPAMPTEAFEARPTVDHYTKASMAELKLREGYEIQMRTALQICTEPIKQDRTD